MERRPKIRLFGTSKRTQDPTSRFIILRIEDGGSSYSITIRKKSDKECINFIPSISKIDKKLGFRYDFHKPELNEDEICHSCLDSMIKLFHNEFRMKRLLLNRDQIWKNGHLELESEYEYGVHDSFFTDKGLTWKSTTKPDKRLQLETKLTGEEVASLHSLTYNDWNRIADLLTQFRDYGRCFDETFFRCDKRQEDSSNRVEDDEWINFCY